MALYGYGQPRVHQYSDVGHYACILRLTAGGGWQWWDFAKQVWLESLDILAVTEEASLRRPTTEAERVCETLAALWALERGPDAA
jgi:hypothetical protein